jgi:GH24 family phage-related lysozyme (muramidase)
MAGAVPAALAAIGGTWLYGAYEMMQDWRGKREEVEAGLNSDSWIDQIIAAIEAIPIGLSDVLGEFMGIKKPDGKWKNEQAVADRMKELADEANKLEAEGKLEEAEKKRKQAEALFQQADKERKKSDGWKRVNELRKEGKIEEAQALKAQLIAEKNAGKQENQRRARKSSLKELGIEFNDPIEQMIAEEEGFETKVYLDTANKPTVGLGHLLTNSERDRKIIDRGEVTKEEALEIFREDIAKHQSWKNKVGKGVDVNANQAAALTSLEFNAGWKASQSVVDLLNQGKTMEAADKFREYNKITKKNEETGEEEKIVSDPHVKRRERERTLFVTPTGQPVPKMSVSGVPTSGNEQAAVSNVPGATPTGVVQGPAFASIVPSPSSMVPSGAKLGDASALGIKSTPGLSPTSTSAGATTAAASPQGPLKGRFEGGPSADGSILLRIDNFLDGVAGAKKIMRSGPQVS